MSTWLLERLRQRARRIAALAVTLFALNWLGLALVPCAMAFEFAAGAAAQGQPAAHEHCPHCPPADAPPCHGHAAPANDAACGAMPKPALETRDAGLAAAPLLLALSGPTLALTPVPSRERGGCPAADPDPCPACAPADRYCRRLE